MPRSVVSRRRFLENTSWLGGGLMAGGSAWLTAGQKPSGGQETGEPQVSPTEDLMREHGLLARALLIYDEVRSRLESGKDAPAQAVAGTAALIRRFVEDYHEKLEEDYLFPRFEKARQLVDLVTVLRQQHQAGRRLTSEIERLAAPASLQTPAGRKQLVEPMRRFVHMYRPHKSREDTVLFPALHHLVSAKEFDALGDEFEDREQKLFGKNGFESMVGEVAKLEAIMGIGNLAAFTPRS